MGGGGGVVRVEAVRRGRGGEGEGGEEGGGGEGAEEEKGNQLPPVEVYTVRDVINTRTCVTALGVLCCFALFVCLTLLASFFHLSFKNMYIHVCAV